MNTTLFLGLVLAAPVPQTVETLPPPKVVTTVTKTEPLTSDLLTAAWLLDCECNTPIPPFGDDWKKIRDAIHFVAIEREIIDPRECRYFMDNIGDFENDLNLLRTRNVQLRNAPKLAEVNRFPERRIISDLISFNRDFKKYLEERLIWENDRADILGVAIKDTDKCYRMWNALQDARCDFQYVTYRRFALAKFRDMIGEEDFMFGKMPEYVPEWAFTTKR